jgi:hypothetical protein
MSIAMGDFDNGGTGIAELLVQRSCETGKDELKRCSDSALDATNDPRRRGASARLGVT